jgi:hypothetical protein
MTARGGAPATPLPGRGPALSTIHLGSRHNALPRCARTARVHARGPVCAPYRAPPLSSAQCSTYRHTAPSRALGATPHHPSPADGRRGSCPASEPAPMTVRAMPASDEISAGRRRGGVWRGSPRGASGTSTGGWPGPWGAAFGELHNVVDAVGDRSAFAAVLEPELAERVFGQLGSSAHLPALAAAEGVEVRAVGFAGRGGSPGWESRWRNVERPGGPRLKPFSRRR